MPASPRSRILSLALIVSAAAPFLPVQAEEAKPAPKKSPFMPASSAAAPAASANEVIEFAGISSMGKRTDLIFFDKTAKKSRWVGVGETVEGISVLSFNPEREEVVVKLNGVQKTLALRKGAGPVNSPVTSPAAVMPLPAPAGFASPTPLAGSEATRTIQPVAPAAAGVAGPSIPAQAAGPATPEQQAKQETEARMLVSDLLEIGMAQRKAYEDAQRKAAEGGGTAAQAAAPGTPTSAPAPKAGGN